MLVIHSRDDAVIPSELGERLFAAANEPKTFLSIDQCHVCGPFYYGDIISQHMIQMVESVPTGTR